VNTNEAALGVPKQELLYDVTSLWWIFLQNRRENQSHPLLMHLLCYKKRISNTSHAANLMPENLSLS